MYAVDTHTNTVREGGAEEVVRETKCFQLVLMTHSRSRPHLMHSCFSADDMSLTKGIALHVRLMDRWQADAALEQGARLVYTESDPEWLLPSRIAPFEDWLRSLR